MRSAVPNCCGGGSRGENRACPLIENYREARSLPRMRGHTTGFVDSASQARERARRQAHRCPAVGNCRSRDWAGINAARTTWIEEQQLTRPLAEANLKLERSVEGSNCLTKAAPRTDTRRLDEARDRIHLAHSSRALAIIVLTKADLVIPVRWAAASILRTRSASIRMLMVILASKVPALSMNALACCSALAQGCSTLST